ncbi:uncharacterized protein [Bemisia tabaci]|uniref:uncharacterized protein isoform X2 n=1 Tax=Bemisia tabaci TaxID=7038 RepID=UPI003B286C77
MTRRFRTFVCKVCNKQFGNQKIYQIHTQIHANGTPEEQKLLAEAEAEAAEAAAAAAAREAEASASGTNESAEKKAPKRKKPTPPPATPPKKKGFTKVRMEDCLRCDECSCIYLDENDYHKHMRNFHGHNQGSRKSPKKKGCRSCCVNCKSGNCNPALPQLPLPPVQESAPLFKFTMQDNIKDRWSKMVSERLSEAVTIKEDPDAPNPALESLLSQVEVKIKTEPQDYYEYE